MDDLIKEFVQESTENLDGLDQDFVKLENDSENSELLKRIFRAIQTRYLRLFALYQVRGAGARQ